MLLEVETKTEAAPEDVYAFFEQVEDNYLDWHPDHITFRWVTGEGLEVGNEAYLEEEIAGDIKKQTIRYTTVEPPNRIVFHPTSRLLRLILPHISFTIEPVMEGSQVTQRLKIRTGPIGRRLNRDEFDAVRQHMKEEGDNLKRIVESGMQDTHENEMTR